MNDQGCSFMITRVLLACLFVTASVRGAAESPQRDAVRKLVEAASKPPPMSADVLVYCEVWRPPRSAEEVRGMVEEMLRPPRRFDDSASLAEDIELNVQRILAEEREPRRLVQRFRIQGGRSRVDQAKLEPGEPIGPQVVLSGTFVCAAGAPDDRPRRF